MIQTSSHGRAELGMEQLKSCRIKIYIKYNWRLDLNVSLINWFNLCAGKTSSAVWNVRATRDTCPSSLSPRHPRSYRRSTTPLINKNKLIKKCQFDRLPDGLVVKIISYLTSVDIINISRTCKRLYFLSWEPDLWTSLTLTSANIETDRAIKSILEILSRNSGLSSVRSVCLNGSTRLTDRGLAVLARRAGLLRQLEVQYCPGVTNGGLLDLVSRCPQLVHLDITGWNSVQFTIATKSYCT